MRTFGLLPSSPDIRDMNDAQWLFCYLNIVKDEEEEEIMWKTRAKYHGMFINPEAVIKTEEFEKTGKIYYPENISKSPENQYVNDDFEQELKNALQNENFIELPQETDIRGNANMSSDEFLNMCLENYYETQNEIEKDLDIIEIE